MNKPVLLAKFVAMAAVVLLTAACSVVPKEAVQLSNTVGRDLEEVHKAHIALAELHFDRIDQDVNAFIDGTYRPAFIKEFASEFALDQKVRFVVESNEPEKLLPLLTKFVEIAVSRVERKRALLLGPIEQQHAKVLSDINQAHRQIQAAQAIVSGHLASVRDVHEAQAELLDEVGLEGLREEIATKTANLSDQVAKLTTKGEGAADGLDEVAATIVELDTRIETFKSSIGI